MTKKGVMYIIGLVVIFVGVMVYTMLPALSDFRNSIYGLIINCLFVVGIVLFCALSKKINQPLLGKITTISYGVLYILCCFIDIGRIEALFFLIYSIINIAIAIYIYKKTKIEYKSIWLFGAFSYLSTITFVTDVKFVDEFNLTIVIISAVIALLAFSLCLFFGIKYYKDNKKVGKTIGITIMGLLGGFVIPWITLSSMNIYLDFSKPTYVEFIIIDKDISSGARQITTYELEVKNETESFTIGVPEETFYDYEIDDTIVLSMYNGAFNQPYYIFDEK